MKVSDLEGAKLDYWVARAEGLKIDGMRPECVVGETPNRYVFCPSGWWKHGGPIIEREQIALWFQDDPHGCYWAAESSYNPDISGTWSGPTPLVAAMRCYVASKFGEEVADDL